MRFVIYWVSNCCLRFVKVSVWNVMVLFLTWTLVSFRIFTSVITSHYKVGWQWWIGHRSRNFIRCCELTSLIWSGWFPCLAYHKDVLLYRINCQQRRWYWRSFFRSCFQYILLWTACFQKLLLLLLHVLALWMCGWITNTNRMIYWTVGSICSTILITALYNSFNTFFIRCRTNRQFFSFFQFL